MRHVALDHRDECRERVTRAVRSSTLACWAAAIAGAAPLFILTLVPVQTQREQSAYYVLEPCGDSEEIYDRPSFRDIRQPGTIVVAELRAGSSAEIIEGPPNQSACFQDSPCWYKVQLSDGRQGWVPYPRRCHYVGGGRSQIGGDPLVTLDLLVPGSDVVTGYLMRRTSRGSFLPRDQGVVEKDHVIEFVDGGFGRVGIRWRDIESVVVAEGVVTITTVAKRRFQGDLRTAGFSYSTPDERDRTTLWLVTKEFDVKFEDLKTARLQAPARR